MGFKKSFSIGAATALLGLALIGGGTFAAFTSEAVSENTFAAGVIDLELNEPVFFDLDRLKPGDTMEQTFILENTGNMTMGSVHLETDYEVIDANGDNGDADFGEHFIVEFIKNNGPSIIDSNNKVVEDKSLAYMKDVVFERIATYPAPSGSFNFEGISPGDKHYLSVKIKFKDTNEIDQNIFQGDQLKLKWTFTGHQQDGSSKN